MNHFLRPLFLGLFVAVGANLYAQNLCIPDRFTANAYFNLTDIIVQNNITYAIAPDYLGNPDTLNFDIYYPNLATDTLKKRPLLVFIHGGGFMDGDQTWMDTFNLVLSQNGYVSASINYRVGWNYGTGSTPQQSCNGSPSDLLKAIYRSIQDTRAALRYFVANASVYGIDTSEIFIGGQSAGSVTALETAYITQQEMDTIEPGVSDTLGLLDTSGNAYRNTFSIKGVMDMWGCLPDTNLINDSTTRIPAILFQGTADNVIPYDTGRLFFCDSPSVYAFGYGARPIADRMQNLGICFELDTLPGAGHGVYPVEYRAQHVACFIRSLMCDSCTSMEVQMAPAPCFVATGIANTMGNKPDIGWFPNPASGTLFIQTQQPNEYHIQLFDLPGQLLMEQTFNGNGSLNISSLAKGMYILRYTLDSRSGTGKIIVE